MTKFDRTNSIAAAYDTWSQNYEQDENRTRDLAAAALRGLPIDLQNRAALEIGCGTGINTRYLVERCRSIIALDFSAGMLEKARVNVTTANIKFVQQDIRANWGVESSSIDLILCTLVLEHIEDLHDVFEEARRVMRPKGDFLIYELHPFRQLQGSQAQFKDLYSGKISLIPAVSHTVSEFVNAAIAAGFELIRIEELGDKQDAAKNAPPRILSLHLRNRA